MAISKERLEQLIKQGETLYYLDIGGIDSPRIVEHNEKSTLYKLVKNEAFSINNFYDNMWFETKEEVEFARDFQHITRTEELNLPTWEEIISDKENCYWDGIYNSWWVDLIKYGIHIYMIISNNILETGTLTINSKVFKGITKENYIEVCKLAKSLFLGKEVQDE